MHHRFNRRWFLNSAARLSAGVAVSHAIRIKADAAAPVSIKRSRDVPATPIPADFIGLGYEKSSVAVSGLLSANNERYVQLIKNLGNKGVLRIGGIVADFSRYEPQGRRVAEPKNTVITRACIEEFGAFLKETGWTTIWSLNFGQGSLAQAVSEAIDVASILGPHLYAIELGNEVENYGKGTKPLRTSPYTYEGFRAEFKEWHRAIVKAVPGVRFAAPDTAASVEWVEQMAKDADDEVQLLTTHYYRGGQKQGSPDQLIYPDPNLIAKLERLARASRESGIAWRMCETNSFFGGGLPGVSDTMLGALWTLDYMLLLALHGCAGINLETGVNQLGFISSYSPIQDNGMGINAAGIPYYGMLAFAVALRGSSQILPIDFDASGLNLTVYACGHDGVPHAIILINRDTTRDAHISLAKLEMGKLIAFRLVSDAIGDRNRVTLGGSSVDTEGRWSPERPELVSDSLVMVPRMTAAVILSER